MLSALLSVTILVSVSSHGILRVPAGRPLVYRSNGLDYTPHEGNGGGVGVVRSLDPVFHTHEDDDTVARIGMCGESRLKEQRYTAPLYDTTLRDDINIDGSSGVLDVEAEVRGS